MRANKIRYLLNLLTFVQIFFQNLDPYLFECYARIMRHPVRIEFTNIGRQVLCSITSHKVPKAQNE